MKYWIYILDEPDTFSVVDMIEHSGTAYLPQLDEMKRGDIVFIALSPLYLKTGCMDS